MNQETIENFIKYLNKIDFDNIVSLILNKVFDLKAIDVDGKGDGGSDYRVFSDMGSHKTIAIQKTVQQADWQKKAYADAEKVLAEHKAQRFFFLTSRSRSSSSLMNLDNKISSNLGMASTSLGATEIAGLIVENNLIWEFAHSINLDKDFSYRDRPDQREIMLHSYFALSNDRIELRDNIYDKTILSTIHFSQRLLSREEILKASKESLGCHENRYSQISSRFDSLLSRGSIKKVDNYFQLNSDISKAFIITDGIYCKELGLLASSQISIINSFKGIWDEEHSEKASVLLAQLFVQKQINTAQHSSLTFSMTGFKQAFGDPEHELRDLIRNSGVSAKSVDKALIQLIEISSNTPIIKKLTRSVIYHSLENVSSSKSVAILGQSSWSDVRVILDVSVAIPYICSRLFDHSKGRFSKGAIETIETLKTLSVKLTIPWVYLNECASHLLRALNYCDLPEIEDSFQYSQNGFVSHYFNLKAMNKSIPPTLEQFIKIFSSAALNPNVEYRTHMGKVMDQLERKFREYGVNFENIDKHKIQDRHSSDIEKEYMWNLKEKKISKASNLIKHDTLVLSHIVKCLAEDDFSLICLTWDGIMIDTGRKIADCGWIISPHELNDIVQPKLNLSQGKLSTLAHTIARTIEKPSQIGSLIIDRIISLAHEELRDWQFMEKVKKFRDEALARIDTTKPIYKDIIEGETDEFLIKLGIDISKRDIEQKYDEISGV